MRKFFVFVFILFPIFAYSQEGNIRVGVEALRDGFYDVAIKEFKAALGRKENAEVRFLLGVAYLKKGEFEKARTALYPVLGRFKGKALRYWSLASLGYALSLISEGKEVRAEKVLKELLKKGRDGPVLFKARYVLSGLLFKRKKYREVIRVLSPVSQDLDPYGVFLLSESYYRIGDRDKSMFLLKGILGKGLNEDEEKGLISLFSARAKCEDILSMDGLERFLKYKPFFLKALSCAALKGNEKILSTLGRFSEKRKFMVCKTFYTISGYYFLKKDFDRVLQESSKLSGCKFSLQDRVNLAFMRGFSFYKKGALKEAAKSLLPVYSLLPGDRKRVSAFILYQYFKRADSNRAFNFMMDCLSFSPSCAYISDAISFSFRKKRYKTVIFIYKKFSKKCAFDDRVRYEVGCSYLEMKDEKGLSLLSSLRSPELSELAVLKSLAFICRHKGSKSCRKAGELYLKKVKSDSLKKKIKELIESSL